MTTPHDDPGIITSEFADDPEMTELVEWFISELPDRIGALRSAAEDRDIETLTTLSHQLKGAAPGYGFTPIGEAAGSAERALLDGDPAAIERVGELIGICSRASARAA